MKKRTHKIVVFGICFLMAFTQFVPVFALDEGTGTGGAPAATEATTAPEPETTEPATAPKPETTEPEETTEPAKAPEADGAADDPGDSDSSDSNKKDSGDTTATTEEPTTEPTEETTEPTGEPCPAFTTSIDTGTVKITVDVSEGAFPEKVKVKSHKVSAGKVKDTVEEELGEEAGDLSAVDISFHNEAGKELEPSKAITLKVNAYGLEGEDYKVVHIADNGAADVVASSEGSRFSFKADSFSIYTIVGTGGDTVRRTYNFYNGDELVDRQIVKNGDKLVEPSVPISGEDGEAFLGWSADGGTTFQKFDKPINDIDDRATEDETVDLYACFDTNLAVIFHDRNGSVIQTVYGKSGDQVSVDDVEFEVMAGEYVSGWTTDSEGSTEGAVTGSVTLEDKNIELYPIIKNVHWLIFHDKGLDDDPAIPTHTESYYLTDNEVTTKPTDPTRPGYTFREWTTDPEGANAFAFGNPLTEDTVVYGQWDPEETDYEVLVWSESLVNEKYVEGNYVLSDHFTFTAPSGSEVSLSETDPLVQDLIASDAYRYHELKKADGPTIVKGDGTTVLNVYFDLKVYTIEFTAATETFNRSDTTIYTGGVLVFENLERHRTYYELNMNGHLTFTFSHDGKTYTDYEMYTIKARYGEDIASRWPSQFTGTWAYGSQATDADRANLDPYFAEFHNYMWNTNDKNRLTKKRTGFIGMQTNVTDALINNNGSDTMRYFLYFGIRGEERGTNHWLQNVEDDEFTKAEKYSKTLILGGKLNAGQHNGFTLIGEPASPGTPEGYDPSGTYDGRYEYNFYYTRNRYPLRFYNYNGIDKEYTGDDALKYETPLESYDYTPKKPAELPGVYVFKGWYTTQGCYDGTEFSFDGAIMPIDGLTLYAKWEAPKYTVSFDSNGGTEIASQTVDYGKQAIQPEPPERAGFTFGGWIKDGSPFNFNTEIYENTKLTARWLSNESIEVVYDAGEHGSNPPEDTNTYLDVAKARVQSSPDVDEGYRFTGWKCGDTVHYPGNLFTVRSSDAEKVSDNKYRITMEAVYDKDVPEVRVIYYRNHPKVSGGDEAYALTEYMPNNDTLKLARVRDLNFEGGGEAPKGWHFLYWADSPDGEGNHYDPGDIVAADFNGDNVLYAIWEGDGCVITYDPNGGTFRKSAEPTDIDVCYGDEITIAEAAVRPGYEFLYWEGSKYYPGDKYTVEGYHVFTAVWKKTGDSTPVPIDPEEPADPDTPDPTDPTTWVTDPEDKARDKSTETGDESQLLLPLVLAITSITTLGALVIAGRRRRTKV